MSIHYTAQHWQCVAFSSAQSVSWDHAPFPGLNASSPSITLHDSSLSLLPLGSEVSYICSSCRLRDIVMSPQSAFSKGALKHSWLHAYSHPHAICGFLGAAVPAELLSELQRQLPRSSPLPHRLLQLQWLLTWHPDVSETPAGLPS